MPTFPELLNTLSEDNSSRGFQFEKLCKWLLENHPIYKSKIKKVWLWEDWPDRWGKDLGIDLIAEDYEKKVWAIQAKCYKPIYSIKKTDVDSFLNESTNKKIHHRLLIASTDRIGTNATNVIKRANEVLPINQFLLTDLLQAPIDWPETVDKLFQAKVTRAFKPRPYQKLAIDNVAKNLNHRGQLIMACGTGKTLISLWIHERISRETTLVLLPSLLLLSKTLTEWLAQARETFKYLPVCSDETVAKSKDAINLSRSDLCFPSTTDIDSIVKFMKTPGRKVIFSTYQSSKKISEAFKSSDLNPIDLVIADEAHRCAGSSDSAYSTILDNNQIPAKKRLFMTATPRIFQARFKKRAAESGLKISSMDDEDIFGPIVHKLSFADAIEPDDGSDPLLSDYQVLVVGIDSPYYSQMISERELVKTDNDIQSDAQSFASHIALAKAINNYDLKRVITFHSRVKAASDFANKLPEVIDWMPDNVRPDGDLVTNFVSGAMPTFDRNKNLFALGEVKDGQRYVLSNARCLSEGIDVPALDGIAFIDPRNSEIDIIQAVGRAIRLSKDKNIGTIVIPVFIDEHEDPDEVLNSSPFKKVWAVVNALRSHDEGLGEQLDQLRKALGKRGTVGVSDKIIFDLPTKITHKFETALKIKLIESTTESWEFWFGLLEVYKETFGDCIVPAKYETDDGYKLGRWTRNQITRKEKVLTKDRIQKLDDIGFVWGAREHKWEQGFAELLIYKEEHGDCIVPQGYKTIEDYNLGAWVSSQRGKVKKGNLTKDQIQRLDDIGFVWDHLEAHFEKGFAELLNYKEEYGDCRVPAKYQTDDEFKLGNWVTVRRYNKQKILTKDQIQRLDDIGFAWDQLDEKWEKGFAELLNYKEEYGDCRVPQRYKTREGYSLGNWVSVKRISKQDLTEDQIQRLDDIGFVWDPRQWFWEKGYIALVNYKEEYGDCRVPKEYQTDEFKLGTWTWNQRRRKKGLTEDKIQRLDDIGFVWRLR